LNAGTKFRNTLLIAKKTGVLYNSSGVALFICSVVGKEKDGSHRNSTTQRHNISTIKDFTFDLPSRLHACVFTLEKSTKWIQRVGG
jgi:hypothetical protein